MKVITFSRVFPAYHPRKGEKTDFVSKIWNGLDKDIYDLFPYSKWFYDNEKWDSEESDRLAALPPKFHTIRAGSRWKAGDWFSPRVWSAKPYRSKQIEFTPPIQVKKVWDIEIGPRFEEYSKVIIDACDYGPFVSGISFIEVLAENDGLTCADMIAWFNKPFTGQIICWNDKIDY